MYDWCSEYEDDPNTHPWISYYLKSKRFEITGYYLRTGGCPHGTCYVYTEKTCANCFLFSWSLQISEDNINWTEIHNVSRDYEIVRCGEKIYKFDKKYSTKYIRFMQTEPFPGGLNCMALNSLDFYGTTSPDLVFEESDQDIDDVSIIGRMPKNRQMSNR